MKTGEMKRQFLILLLAITLILSTTTVVVNGKCVIDEKNNKKGVEYKVEIALNWNKESDPAYDATKMSPGYVVAVVHNSDFKLFNESVDLSPQVKLLLEKNIFIEGKKLGSAAGADANLPQGLKNWLAINSDVYRFAELKNPAPDQTVKLNTLVNGTHTFITILGNLVGKPGHFYGTKKAIPLCVQDNKPLLSGLPSAPLTAYKLDAEGQPTDNSLKSSYGKYTIATGSYWNLANECFPKNARVTLENGRTKYMGQLKVGDRVAVGDGKFSMVFMFTHQLPHEKTNFVQLTTVSGNTLKLTSGHFVAVNGYQYKPAMEVRHGDAVRLEDGSISRIVDIQTVQDIGLYNPQTTHGDIVVDGVVASTYTVTIPPKMAHAMLAPLRGLAARFAAFGAFRMQSTA